MTNTDNLAKGWELAGAGDVQGAMRELRAHAADVPASAAAPLVGRVAGLAEMPDLADAAAALAAGPGRPQELYDYGRVCVERGAAFLAVPALDEALRLVPDARGVLVELVSALENEERHREAVALLQERESAGPLPAWPERYLLAYNAMMAGEPETARLAAATLPEPTGGDEMWRPAFDRVHRMLDRWAVGRGLAPLDRRDLRGWHYVLTGGVLTTLSPHGFAAGMTGRWAFVQDGESECLAGLRRLGLVVEAAGLRPRSVSVLSDRSSRILGIAAARLLGLPAKPYRPGRSDTIVVAYDLNEVEDDVPAGLRERQPGQVLYEHSTCWTDPPAVSADVSTQLVQMCTAPWGARMRMGEDGAVEDLPEDARPPEEVAAGILAADPAPDPGDGETPPDPDEALVAFVSGLRGRWPDGPRERVRLPGPVPSGRFL